MGRREAKKQLKRERMMKEGLRLFLEQGYERASVEQIAQAVGVARGTFYLYFPDKLALFAALMGGWHDTVMGMLSDVHAQLSEASTEAEAWQIYRDMGSGLSWVGLANRDEILLAFREMRTSTEAGQLLRERELAMIDAAVGFTQTAQARGLIDVVNPKLSVLVVIGAVERLFYEMMLGTDLGDPALVAAQVVEIFEGAMTRR